VRIVTIKDVGTVTSDIPDGTYAGAAIGVWSSMNSYAVDAVTYDNSTRPHHVFRCINAIAGSVDNKRPADSSDWRLIGSTDRDAEFDDLINTASQKLTSHTVTIDSSGTNYIALFALDAIEITFTLTSLGQIQKSETINLRQPPVAAGWWEYFFTARESRRQIVWEYPKYVASTLTITIKNWDGVLVKCGALKWGVVSSHIASVQRGLTAQLVDYSTKGKVYVVDKGPSADDIDLSIFVSVDQVDSVRNLIKAQTGRIAIYDCNSENYRKLDGFVLLAIYKSFTRVFAYRDIIKCNLSLQGVA